MSTTGGRQDEIPSTIFLTEKVKIRQERLVTLCPDEVFWIGLIEEVEQGGHTYLQVYDLLVPKQEVSGGSVDWEDSLNELMTEMIKAGRGDEIGNMRYFGHSHVNMSVFHSGKDMKQIWDFANIAELDWFISTVHNKKGESLTRFDMFKPFRMHVNLVTCIGLVPVEHTDWATEMLKEKVTKKAATTYGNGWHTTGQAEYWVLDQELANLMYPEKNVFASLVMRPGIREIKVGGKLVMSEDAHGLKYHGEEEILDRFNAAKVQRDSRSVQRSAQKRAEGKAGKVSLSKTDQTQTAGSPASDSPVQNADVPRRQQQLQLGSGMLSAEDLEIIESFDPMDDMWNDPEVQEWLNEMGFHNLTMDY